MRTLGTRARNGKKAAVRHAAAHERPHPAIAKLAVALKGHKETLEQQAATAEILRIIASGPGSPTSVFEAITRAGTQLLPGTRVALFLVRDGQQHYVSHSGIADTRRAKTAAYFPRPVDRTLVAGATILDKKVLHFPDLRAAEAKRYTLTVEIARKVGYRALLSVPLLRAGRAIGALTIGRVLPGPFTKQQIALVKIFADQAVIAIENARLFNETKEALERQTATADILQIISSSPTDLRPVFDGILDGATRLCGAHLGILNLYEGGRYRSVAVRGGSAKFAQWAYGRGAFEPDPITTLGRMTSERRPIQVADVKETPAYRAAEPVARKFVELGGARTYVAVPMLKDNRLLGAISIYRNEVAPFTDKQIELVKTFANQAVIAIENARLFNETKEALERQTATADVLKVISDSPTDVQPVFQAVADRAAQLCDATHTSVLIAEGDVLRRRAVFGPRSQRPFAGIPIRRTLINGRAYLECRTVHVEDALTVLDAEYPDARENQRAAGFRTILSVPMIREGKAIGAIGAWRRVVKPFTRSQIELLEMFAAQAVIAIENARLFNETKEALERQTATGEILSSISSSINSAQPVFDAIVRNLRRLFGTAFAAVFLARDDKVDIAAADGEERFIAGTRAAYPLALDDEEMLAVRAIRRAQVLRVCPIIGNPQAPLKTERLAKASGYDSIIVAPMLRDGVAIGAIATASTAPVPFDERQVSLIKSFADQAVIAIENARLFNETKEALERQTATADILKVIASSPSDVQPVFEAIVQSAVQLCGARFGRVYRHDGSIVEMVASHGLGSAGLGQVQRTFPRPAADDTIVGRVILTKQPFFIKDIARDDRVPELSRQMMEAIGTRSQVTVPMLRAGEAIGAITMGWEAPGAFNDQQVALLQTFADQAVIAVENARLFNETKEAFEHQQASADILRIVSQSVADSRPAFEAILAAVRRLFAGFDATVWRVEQDRLVGVARGGPTISSTTGHSVPIKPEYVHGIAILERRSVRVDDVASSREISEASRQDLLSRGRRAILLVPFVRDEDCVGAISVSRTEPYRFSEKQVALLQAFASQAVIAIENARLFNETKEALERQTATAEVLRVISGSPTNVQPVFDAIAERAAVLCGAKIGVVTKFDGELLHLVAFYGASPELVEPIRAIYPLRPGSDTTTARAVRERAPAQIPDLLADPDYVPKQASLHAGYRSNVAVPLLREGSVIGAISVARAEIGPFSDKEIGLLQTFANQAVIAIENARLFNETKEALEQQTVTADILNVISVTPTDTQPVFEAIAKSALNIFGGMHVGVGLVEGDAIEIRAGTLSYLGKGATRIPLNRETYAGRAVLDGTEFNVSDVEAPGTPPLTRERARLGGWRAVALVPMLREGIPIGHISVHRDKPVALDDKQFALLRTFARQAVIAIENVRLFTELRATNATLTEALEQQTATAEVLNAISSSVADTRPVFQKILESTERLFAGRVVGINVLGEDGMIHLGAYQGAGREEFEKVFPLPVDRNSGSGLAIVERRVVHIPDTEADGVPEAARRGNRARGNRASLYAPMMSRDKAIGVIWVSREMPGPFREKEIALLKTFTDQAVIAIENARLFKELQERTEALTKSVDQLTALGEVGQAISSTLDLETVLKTIVSRAVQLTGLDAGAVYEYEELTEQFHLRAAENMSEEMVELLRRTPIRKGEGAVGGTAVAREPIQIPETHDESYRSQFREVLIRTGRRALLAVPLMREDYIIGALTVQRNTPGPFAPEVVELLKTFATQSAMAIQNARLFREIAEKGRQLEVASEHKSQFLASMSHELRTPLNALLGFNEMLLGGVYGEVPGDMGPPLAQMQSSGKQLLRLINNVLDLAKIEAGRMELALADYSVHDVVEGVRSTLQPLATEKGLQFLAAVPADVPLAHGDSGRIAQCLMNLAGNSLKFTKAGKVEISVAMNNGQLRYCVADTGIGIPPDKIGSLFTEFRQTDATVASEYGGTGLGLSISKKFVEMHGGRIWVESEPGRGSVFTFEVPLRAQRGAAAA